jgi:hypothetical protein
MSVKIKQTESISLPEAVVDLSKQIADLQKAESQIANCLALVQANQNELARRMEIAKNNIGILQDLYINKSAIPIARN